MKEIVSWDAPLPLWNLLQSTRLTLLAEMLKVLGTEARGALPGESSALFFLFSKHNSEWDPWTPCCAASLREARWTPCDTSVTSRWGWRRASSACSPSQEETPLRDLWQGWSRMRNVLWKDDPVESAQVLSEKAYSSSLKMGNRLCHVHAESSLAWFSQVTWCPLWHLFKANESPQRRNFPSGSP